ncbi:MAG TPA: gamma carbonic anhydrase family protein [Candidatus Polarisedimenticolaceae bacterium]|nr:gamma carbonic anhydrase family protein [Candidatus Polarisedimenticolaceae bacterium]
MTTLTVHPDAWIAPGAVVRGHVTIGAFGSIWFGCVLRGDLEPITIGEGSNVQDLTVVHVDRGYPAVVGKRVTIGHRAIVHGALVEDEAVVGMGAVLLSGCTIGKGALVAAGAVVTEGFAVPPGRIAAGVPARLRGEVGEDLRERFARGVESYIELARGYREAE